jgi:hypothetical protein
VAFDGPDGAAANLKAASLRWTGAPDSLAATRHPNVPVTRTLSATPPPDADSILAIAATTWNGTTHRDTVAAGVPSSASARTAALPVPPIPTRVWVVIGGFVAVLLGIVGTWLTVAGRTERRRAEVEDEAPDRPPEAVPVAADLPTTLRPD